MLHGNFGENLAVEVDLAGFERSDELGVVRTVQTGSGIDAHLLESAVIALLELAADIGIASGLGSCRFGERDLGFASPHHALGTGHDILAALDAVCTAFYTRHIWLGVDQRLKRADIGLVYGDVTALVAGDLAGLAAVEVVLAAFAFQELTGFGDDQAFGQGLGSFLFHMMVMTYVPRWWRHCRRYG